MVKVEPDVLPLDLAQPQDAQRIKQLPPEANWQQVKVATQSDTVIVKNSTYDSIPSDKLGKEPFPKVDSQQVMESNTEKNSTCDSNYYKTLGLIIPSEISQADPQNLEQKQQICPDVTEQNPKQTDHICKENQQSGESVKTQSQKPTSPKQTPKKIKQQATKQKQTKRKNAQKAIGNDSKQMQTRITPEKNHYERFHSQVRSVLNAVMLKCNSKIAKLLVYFLIFGFALQIVASEPIMVEFKEQILPWKCRSHFSDPQECPYFNSEHETLNKMCCQGFGGAVLHCLSHFDTDAERRILSISCLPDSTVPAGKYLTIIPHNGLPQKVVQTCPPGHFEPKERKSSQIRHPYCQRKTQCNATEGQQILCDRGPVGQDLCRCSPGYEPKYWNMSTSPCKGGFDSNYPCVCDKVPCPPGTARNISYGSLSDSECQKKISIDYACTNISSTVKTDTTTPSNTTPAQDQGTSGAVEKPKDLSFLALLVLILPISLVVYVWCNYGAANMKKNIVVVFQCKINPSHAIAQTPCVYTKKSRSVQQNVC